MAAPQQEGFINNVSEDEITTALRSLQRSSLYLTEPTYRGNAEKWPNNQMSFIDFHLSYLKIHPTLDPRQYISNLKLILKKSFN